jgi:hypothetical protein
MNTLLHLLSILCWVPTSFAFVPLSTRSAVPTGTNTRLVATSHNYSNVTLEDQKLELKSRLPPITRDHMSKLEVEFRELLESILYTPRETESVTNPRLRAIYEGVAASYYEPAVYRAFEVLFEDYIPLRIAGRLVYRKLQQVMDESKAYQQVQMEAVVAKTGLSMETVQSSWASFCTLAQDRDIPIDQVERILLLLRGGELDLELFQSSSSLDHDGMLSQLNPDQNDSLTFEELMTGLNDLSTLNSPPDMVLQELFDAVEGTKSSSSKLDKKRAKYNQRYDDMLTKFGEWKAFIPDGEGRRLDILRGCFVGSENPKVVEALRIIYTDNGALRLSGDWIFKVVSTLMNATLNRRHDRR